MTRLGFKPPMCECGHPVGDHPSNRTTFPHPLRHGRCRVEGCECRGYVEVGEEDRDAA